MRACVLRSAEQGRTERVMIYPHSYREIRNGRLFFSPVFCSIITIREIRLRLVTTTTTTTATTMERTKCRRGKGRPRTVKGTRPSTGETRRPLPRRRAAQGRERQPSATPVPARQRYSRQDTRGLSTSSPSLPNALPRVTHTSVNQSCRTRSVRFGYMHLPTPSLYFQKQPGNHTLTDVWQRFMSQTPRQPQLRFDIVLYIRLP